MPKHQPVTITPDNPATTIFPRIPAYCDSLRNLAAEEGVALADVNREWINRRTRRYPPYVMLHNNNNHPGVEGHRLLADVILRCLGVE